MHHNLIEKIVVHEATGIRGARGLKHPQEVGIHFKFIGCLPEENLLTKVPQKYASRATAPSPGCFRRLKGIARRMTSLKTPPKRMIPFGNPTCSAHFHTMCDGTDSPSRPSGNLSR